MNDSPMVALSAAAPLAQRVARGSIAVALSSYGVIAFGFGANLVLTRLLAPEDFGAFSLATFFATLLNVRRKLGVDAAFAQSRASDGAQIGTHLALGLAAALASLVLACAAVPILAAFHYSATTIAITLALGAIGVADALQSTALVLLEKNLLFTRASLVTFVAFPLSYAPAFYLAGQGGGAWSIVAQSATYALLLGAGMWLTCGRYLSALWRTRWSFSRAIAAQFLRFGVAVGATTIAETFLFQFDNLLVGSWVSVAALGYYERAYRIADWTHLLISAVLARPVFYAYAQWRDDAAQLARAAQMSVWVITRSAFPLALAVFIAAPDLVHWLFGERWLPAAPFLRVLVAFSILRPLIENAGTLFVAAGQPQRKTIVATLQAGALVALATPLTLQGGAMGTATGVGIAFGLGLLASNYFAQRTVRLALGRALVAPMLAMGATLALYALTERGWDFRWGLAERTLVKLTFGICVYHLAAFLLEPRTTLERSQLLWRLLLGKEKTPKVE